MIAITICATKSYTYAMTAQARRIQCAVNYAQIDKGIIILVSDESKSIDKIANLYKELLPKWEINRIERKFQDGHENYQENAQLTISQMRTAAFSCARSLDIDYCLSLDSDVLPPINSIQCMLWALQFDNGYYSISTCTYPSQGGGGFLGGRGTIYRQILPDFYEDEREIPETTVSEMKELREKVFKSIDPRKITPEEQKELEQNTKSLQELEKGLDKYPPKGNVWKVNTMGWRKRGWLDNAYPAIGKGALLPSDWCGFGCTLMNKNALNMAIFDGYAGKGTEDLYIVWNRWYSQNLKICVLTHCLCDHIIRDKTNPNKYIHCQSYHETEGECVGHIRLRYLPFYPQDIGEKYNPENDGKLNYPETQKPKEETKEK